MRIIVGLLLILLFLLVGFGLLGRFFIQMLSGQTRSGRTGRRKRAAQSQPQSRDDIPPGEIEDADFRDLDDASSAEERNESDGKID